MAVAFQAYGRPLEMVMEFKYLGWVITASGGNWTAVVSNISKAFIIWASLSIILWQEGVDPYHPLVPLRTPPPAVHTSGTQVG